MKDELKKITAGSKLVLVGTLVWITLEFLSRVIIGRHFSSEEYGIYNLTLSIFTLSLLLATLGFQSGVPREISYYSEKSPSKVDKLISTALIIIMATSVLVSLVLVINAENIAGIFKNERLISPLRVISLALPFSALSVTITAISRGFGRVKEQICFQNIFYPTILLILIVVVILRQYPFNYVFWAYVGANYLTFLALFILIWKIKLVKIGLLFDSKLGKELLLFSIPLLLSSILGFVMTWIDTLMIGYYLSATSVGVYNAAAPIAKLLPVILNSVAFLYVPVASKLYAQNRVNDLAKIYQSLTRLVFFFTFPVFVIVLLYPETILGYVFGSKYITATPALRILAVGFIVHVLFGLNGMSLVIIGKTTLNLVGELTAVLVNVILNILLIPKYYLIGAAIATTFSYILANLVRSFWLYRLLKIHPFTREYIRQITVSVLTLAVAYLLSVGLFEKSLGFQLIGGVSTFVMYFGIILLSGSVSLKELKVLLE
ncbi:flippase [Thermococcus barophilus]|uniref:Uncharacterized protein n=1 Tax=Thermococcus barophilus (strain DSM 11836 / MP) TaxID=391623 RepID=F0LLZ4_THEBM|nr:flippase [Thermococcus barophilus]ADT85093.1 hypothetical protein TERMP_02119 [Thermococcus barophilus MP]